MAVDRGAGLADHGNSRPPQGRDHGRREGVNTMRYGKPEIERIAHVAFRGARGRRRKVCSVDNANVLETMQLWRETVARVGKDDPDIELTHFFVDAAAPVIAAAAFTLVEMPLLKHSRHSSVLFRPD